MKATKRENRQLKIFIKYFRNFRRHYKFSSALMAFAVIVFGEKF